MAASLSGSVMISVGAGELIDKITILEIKKARMGDPEKLRNVDHELAVLREARRRSLPATDRLDRLEADLREVNEALWAIEDDIRACEASRDFGSRFVELARSVYKQNDQRAALKKQINLLCGSDIIEEKAYARY